jgi:hypothetical protein
MAGLMKGNIKIIIEMAKEYLRCKKGKLMKVNGKMIKEMAKE